VSVFLGRPRFFLGATTFRGDFPVTPWCLHGLTTSLGSLVRVTRTTRWNGSGYGALAVLSVGAGSGVVSGFSVPNSGCRLCREPLRVLPLAHMPCWVGAG
jgi:hypothetical protein